MSPGEILITDTWWVTDTALRPDVLQGRPRERVALPCHPEAKCRPDDAIPPGTTVLVLRRTTSGWGDFRVLIYGQVLRVRVEDLAGLRERQ